MKEVFIGQRATWGSQLTLHEKSNTRITLLYHNLVQNNIFEVFKHFWIFLQRNGSFGKNPSAFLVCFRLLKNSSCFYGFFSLKRNVTSFHGVLFKRSILLKCCSDFLLHRLQEALSDHSPPVLQELFVHNVGKTL
jgi:hypothetical protein